MQRFWPRVESLRMFGSDGRFVVEFFCHILSMTGRETAEGKSILSCITAQKVAENIAQLDRDGDQRPYSKQIRCNL